MIRFECYDPSSDGSSGIHAWYLGLVPTFKAQMDAALEDLALERDLDSAELVETLHGACEGLLEVKIDFVLRRKEGRRKENIHIRILGFEWPERRTLTLRRGFQKTPADISYGPHCRAALGYREGVMKDGRRSLPCRFP
jgi:hypothetical protein